jgi:molybdopterin-guanine dinucleotide biosynthesis protein A
MKIPMPAAVLAGGASTRMGLPKAGLPYGGMTLLAHQTSRLAGLFEEVLAVVKEPPGFDAGPARLVFDRSADRAAVHGLIRALEEANDRVFVLAVDLPAMSESVLGAVARAGLQSGAPAVLPFADGHLQPLAAVWSRTVLPVALSRIARGDRSLAGLAEQVGAEVFPEEAWRSLDPSGNSFANLNTIERYLALRGTA